MNTSKQTRLPLSALRRRQIATLAWVYFVFIAIATVLLGTFAIAFAASLKDDPLESPFHFIFPQVMPTVWVTAADLGRQGGSDSWWGGFAPDGDIAFTLVYGAPEGVDLVDPTVEVPRRKPGSGLAAAITTTFASDYAIVTLIGTSERPFEAADPETGAIVNWTEKTFDYRIHYDPEATEGIVVERVPFTALAPRTQILLDSTLPVTQMERRGRVASWKNISPGALGLILNNYRRVINETVDLTTGDRLFFKWMGNSFLIAMGRVITMIVLSSLAGYALARLRFRGVRLAFVVVIFSMTIPAQVTFISNYLVIRDIGLLNTNWSVIMVAIASAHVLLMKQFFESFPREIEEAARVEGANRFQVFLHVVLPNAKPALITNAIMAFQGAWNDFFWPFVLITSPPSALTVPVGLLSLRNSYGGGQGDWGLVLAGAFISIVPVLIMFILFQRYIIQNQVSEGVK
jgi:multiple sugar transport system permease protein